MKRIRTPRFKEFNEIPSSPHERGNKGVNLGGEDPKRLRGNYLEGSD